VRRRDFIKVVTTLARICALDPTEAIRAAERGPDSDVLGASMLADEKRTLAGWPLLVLGLGDVVTTGDDPRRYTVVHECRVLMAFYDACTQLTTEPRKGAYVDLTLDGAPVLPRLLTVTRCAVRARGRVVFNGWLKAFSVARVRNPVPSRDPNWETYRTYERYGREVPGTVISRLGGKLYA
jgi:hypothetical protein